MHWECHTTHIYDSTKNIFVHVSYDFNTLKHINVTRAVPYVS